MKLLKGDSFGPVLYVPVISADVKQTIGKDILNNKSYMVWNLYPVAIYDYINPDWSDAQGWKQEIQGGQVHGDMETIIQYPFDESFEQCCEENDYKVVNVNELTLFNYDRPENEMRKTISIEEAIENALK